MTTVPPRAPDSSGGKHKVKRTKEIQLVISAGLSVRGGLGAARPYFQHVGVERGQGTTIEEGKTGPSSRDEVQITQK